MMDADPIPRLNAALDGRYRIERELGAGGMATVYLAEDLKHERKVALKVLKPELAAVVGAERFLAEIKTTANLQHPHILGLHDSGEADGLLFYVMPYVAGESLRDRLDREHQLPVDLAVRIATNLAEALDYAHRQGVIHRDIKPGNILLQEGKPVISDFGIALAVNQAGGGRLTESGLSLGTPHYMSPEQATGDPNVGPATDVYALGCVLYEMLVGEAPFTGSTPQAVLGRIITGETPSAREERSSVPQNVDAVIRRALEKVPADRFTGADDFGTALSDPGFRHEAGFDSDRGSVGHKTVATTMAAASVMLVVVGIAVVVLLSRPPDPLPLAAAIPLPPDVPLNLVASRFLDLSPDGRTVVYNGGSGASGQIYLRPLDGFQTEVVPGTEGAGSVLFSSDGQSVVYSIGNEVRSAPVGGGPSVGVCTENCREATWGRWAAGDTIVFQTNRAGLWQMPASSGERTPLTTLDVAAGEIAHVWPEPLPGGGILYGVRLSTGEEEIRFLSDGESRRVIRGASVARYANGWLLYAAGSSLFAVGFHPTEGLSDGEPVPLVDDLFFDGRPTFAVGDEGTLVYVPATPSSGRSLLRVSRDGDATVLASGERQFELPRLSPEDSTLLLFSDRGDIWTFDIASKIERRLTSGGGYSSPIWAPGGRVLYQSSEGGITNIFMKSADERDDGQRFLASEQVQWPVDVTPDGGTLVFAQESPVASGDIWTVPFIEGGEPTLRLGDPFTTWTGGVSPDGRWLVYVSDENGFDVYVTDFPDFADHRRVSIDGGTEPAWSPRGDELFYRDGERMMVVAYRTDEDGEFDHEPARELFEGRLLHCCPGLPEYAVAADGQSFFMLQGGGAFEIRVWRGWEERVR